MTIITKLLNLELHHLSRAEQYQKLADMKLRPGLHAGCDLAEELIEHHKDLAKGYHSDYIEHLRFDLGFSNLALNCFL